MFQSRCKILSRGFGPSRFVQPGWRGELPAWRQAEPVIPDRGLPANPAGVNSSTMKGPQGLASEFCGRRCQTAKDFRRRVRGCFYVRSPEITSNHHGANDAGSGELRIRWRSLRVTPDSDVTRKTKNMANAGSSAAAGVVPGAWRGKPGDSNAVEWECGLSRSRPGGRAMFRARQCGLVRRYGWCRAMRRRKG